MDHKAFRKRGKANIDIFFSFSKGVEKRYKQRKGGGRKGAIKDKITNIMKNCETMENKRKENIEVKIYMNKRITNHSKMDRLQVNK